MNVIDNIENLLSNNLITKQEYDMLLKRASINESTYEYTWKDILDGLYDWCKDKYTLSTAKGYKTCLYKFVLYLTKVDSNEVALKKVFEPYSYQKVNNFINKMFNENFKSQSISKTRYAIIALGDYLKTLNVEIPDVSSIKVSIRAEVNNTTIALPHDEIMGIIEHGDIRSKVCLLLCYECALKRNELCNVKVKDFNMANRQLVIYDNDGRVVRVCTLSKSTTMLILSYIDELYDDIDSWNKSRALRGREPRDDYGYIFQSVKMVKPSYSVLQTMVKNTAKSYYENLDFVGNELNEKVQQVTFESIRNSRKVYLLSQGYSVNDVMKMCGEKNYMSTHRFENLVNLLYPKHED